MPPSLVLKVSEKFLNKIKKNESILREAESSTSSQVIIDERNMVALIQGKEEKSDVLKIRDFIIALDNCVDEYTALDIIKRDYMLYLIDLRNIFSKDDVRRVLARVIGEGGKIKSRISEITGCSIIINEPNIILIGGYEDVEYAKQAIQIIVDGSPYTKLFKYLEKVRREKELKEIREFNR